MVFAGSVLYIYFFVVSKDVGARSNIFYNYGALGISVSAIFSRILGVLGFYLCFFTRIFWSSVYELFIQTNRYI